MSKRLLLATLASVSLLVAGIGLWLALRPAPAADLVTATVTVGDVEQTVLATGKLRPRELVTVGAQVSGQVERLYVALGQSVRKGDPIADIDDKPQRLALLAARASERALLAQKAARQGTLVQAELALRRQQTMLEADATTRAELEAAEAALASNRAELGSLDAQLALSRTQTETARLNLGLTRIVAPLSGVVVAVVTKQGQTVNSLQSAPAIVVLADLSVMTVRAEISEADVDKVRPGQPVWFTTLGATERRHTAQIERIEPAPESIAAEGAAGTPASAAASTAVYYNAIFHAPNPDGALRPSMTVQVSVLLARAHDAVIIPSSALGAFEADGRHVVRVLDERRRPTERRVRIGIASETHVVVLDGLRPGERVVIAEARAEPQAAAMGWGF